MEEDVASFRRHDASSIINESVVCGVRWDQSLRFLTSRESCRNNGIYMDEALKKTLISTSAQMSVSRWVGRRSRLDL